MSYEPKMLICNVRGLNDRARRTSVRSVVGTTGASIICLQETKLAVVTLAIVMETLGADFMLTSACQRPIREGGDCGLEE
jgi:exonuclease III